MTCAKEEKRSWQPRCLNRWPRKAFCAAGPGRKMPQKSKRALFMTVTGISKTAGRDYCSYLTALLSLKTTKGRFCCAMGEPGPPQMQTHHPSCGPTTPRAMQKSAASQPKGKAVPLRLACRALFVHFGLSMRRELWKFHIAFCARVCYYVLRNNKSVLLLFFFSSTPRAPAGPAAAGAPRRSP